MHEDPPCLLLPLPDLLLPLPIYGLSAGLLFEAHVRDSVAALDGLAHVVDGERGDGRGCERLHLDAGLCRRRGLGLDADAFVYDFGAHVNVRERQWVAQWDEF